MATNNRFEDGLEKNGYKDAWDFVGLCAGGYGVAFTAVNLVFRIVASGSAWVMGPAIILYIIVLLIYLGVMLFPLVARFMAPKLRLPIAFDELSWRFLLLFTGTLVALLMAFLDPVNSWAHVPVLVGLVIVLVVKASK